MGISYTRLSISISVSMNHRYASCKKAVSYQLRAKAFPACEICMQCCDCISLPRLAASVLSSVLCDTRENAPASISLT